MPSTLTYTGTIGPGNTLTSKVFPNLKLITFDLVERVIHVEYDQNNDNNIRRQSLAYAAVATVTYTISGQNATITIS